MDIESLLEKLTHAGFDAVFVENAAEARAQVEKIIEQRRADMQKPPHELTVSWGGSKTLDECGIRDLVCEKYNALNPYAFPKEEQTQAKRQALLSDIFLMSTNALCESGELVNIDGNGNRLGALIYGPDTVICVIGVNKIVPDVKSAYARIKKIACVKNAKRLNRATPCAQNGVCGNCYIDSQTICSHTVITRFCSPKGRIKLVIVNEELGF